MKRWRFFNCVYLWLALFTGCLSAVTISPGWADVKSSNEKSKSTLTSKIRHLIEHPIASAQQLVQSPAPPNTPSVEVVQVTAVKANPTAKSVEVILQTTKGEQLQVTNRSAGNSFIANIPNAQLRLPSGEAFTFRSEKPLAGITEITVTNVDANTIRVTVIGEASSPTVELFDSDEGLIFGLTTAASTAKQPPQTQPTPQAEQPANQTQPQQPSASSDQPIELVVTGEQDGYSVPDASTATRTDTPLRDIPQSIQVVPQQVIKDQQVIRASEALRNVSGVQRSIPGGGSNDRYTIRGFDQSVNLRDGFRDSNAGLVETANLERIEVLKGPASVLYGNVEPGGVINFVTKQPLENPFYSFGVQAGSFGLVRPTLDISGPLNPERTLLYRLNAVYQKGGDFRDFDQEGERYFVSPVLSWKIGDRTNLTLEFEHVYDERPFDRGLVAIGRGVADIPYDRVLGERDDRRTLTEDRVGYRLEHGLSEDWKLRSRFQFSTSHGKYLNVEIGTLNEQTGEADRTWNDSNTNSKEYVLQNDLVGKFSTAWVKHTLLFGVDLLRTTFDADLYYGPALNINIFNPVYGTVPRPNRDQLPDVFPFPSSETNSFGIFLQDQVALTDNLKLLLGGRFDLVDQKSTSEQQDDAFTPRVGIVYQPIQPISLYASFSQSFQPNSGNRADGSLLEPQRDTQYEAGIKGEFLNNSLTATLAAYEITKSNVATPDPNYPESTGFVIPIGEVRSRGIELDIAGEILPGWNVIASYAYTDAKITQSNDGQQGNQLASVPYNAASLWTTYELQTGNWKGLGFGLGLFYVGDRQGDLANDFKISSYLRTDASIFYRRNSWKLGLNFNNLFNVNYIDVGQNRTSITPGEPFTVVGSLSVEF
ncbi:TonB-dependent receptor [uncultured Nostoc sp.]|uniref:TonB-dependent receptor n=1 Tax=uncultured Nostoc sp. TaxID=340711 RepID=UPI0026370965|nr:TonB-dependent receptor [uncultured Nostoc sp.]